MRRWPLVVLIVAILAVGGRYLYGALNQPDDKTLIQAALNEAVKAAKEGRPGSVVDLLSANFKLNDEETGNRRIADVIRKGHPDVTIHDMEPVVSGGTAQITSDVDVKISFLNMSGGSGTFKNVQFLFTKEPAMEWLIFPTTKWRLSAARVDPKDLPDFPMP